MTPSAVPFALSLAFASASVVAAPLAVADRAPEMALGVNRIIPVRGWTVDIKGGIEAIRKTATKGSALKAASDAVTVFRPVVPCRLFDTRSSPSPAPAVAGTTFAPNTRQTVVTNGNCGIPTTQVKGISLTLITFNHTTNTGGFISLVAPGASITGTNDIFNFGAQWSGTSVNVPTDSTGSFDVYVSQATADVIIDVNGYYQNLDFVDTGNQELNIFGAVTDPSGSVFEVSNTGAGAALTATNFNNPPGPSLRIISGSLNVEGAGVATPTAAFIMQVDTSSAFGGGAGNLCGGSPSLAVIDHPMLNSDPNAIVVVTPRESFTTPPGGSLGPVGAIYLSSNVCSPSAGARWAIRDKSGSALVNGAQYSVLIVKTN